MKMVVALLAVLVALTFVGSVKAEDHKQKKTEATFVRGKVTKVDAASKTLTIATKSEEKVVTYTDTTEFVKEGQPATADAVTVGILVSAKVDATNVASRIEIVKKGKHKEGHNAPTTAPSH